MNNPVLQVQHLGQSMWYDNVRRGLLTSGEMGRLIDMGVTGVTSNPTILEKAIAGSTDYDDALLALIQDGKSVLETYEALAIEDIRATADLLRPVYDHTDRGDGYASLEVSPNLAHDTEGTVDEARRLHATLDRPNVMIKVPATPEGIPAIRRLIGEGINVNVTLIFSLEVYKQVREAYLAGLENLLKEGGQVGEVASVASFFVSRVDTAVDALLEERIRLGQNEVKALLGKAAIANAKLAYRDFQDTFQSKRFSQLGAERARVQRPLWASTGTKNPAYSDLLYVESLMGKDTVNTMPPATLTAFLEHGVAKPTIEQEVHEAQQTLESLASAGLSMEQVTDKLLADGVKAFADSFDKLLDNIKEKRTKLLEPDHIHPGVSLGSFLPMVESTMEDLDQRHVVERIWRKDHTVWKQDPREIIDRLGWLTVSDQMCEQATVIEAFAKEVMDAGFRHVVLLGMGGSSLGPEVIRQTFGSVDGYPELVVLDSTVPARVTEVAEAIDPAKTLFLVSSKSGNTTEPLSFYAHFRGLVEELLGKDRAGSNFVAITDPGTSLERLAQEHGFRRVFSNPPDIGGRYSVLSYFGLVPAALAGVDIATLLDRADCMREGSTSCVPTHENPGVWLGAVMGTLANHGRDKLTVVTSPAISSFGLWVEQLIAESTGKESTGIVPIAGEPLAEPSHYGDDRLFVYLRLEGDDNEHIDTAMDAIAGSGQPMVRLGLKDRYDLGGEFFRWELATAVAGSLIGIHPFDQPDVQAAKDSTEQLLNDYQATGVLPQLESQESLKSLLAQAKSGEYLAIMAYLGQTPEIDLALADLRRKAMERYGIATTLGYGPRFLHSTGQLHKGGPDNGYFLQLVTDHGDDLPIPGKPYSFGVLADAQALGDMQALQASGRRVARIQVGRDGAASIRGLIDELG